MKILAMMLQMDLGEHIILVSIQPPDLSEEPDREDRPSPSLLQSSAEGAVQRGCGAASKKACTWPSLDTRCTGTY